MEEILCTVIPYLTLSQLQQVRSLSQCCLDLVDSSPELGVALQAHPFNRGRIFQHNLHMIPTNVQSHANNWDSFRDVRWSIQTLSHLGGLATFQLGRNLQYKLDHGCENIYAKDLDLETLCADKQRDDLWKRACRGRPEDRSIQVRFGPQDQHGRAQIYIYDCV